MGQRTVIFKELNTFRRYLQSEEREPGTIEKYLREVRAFLVWAGEREVSKDLTTAWKEHLKSQKFQPETVNAKLSALNKFLRFLGREDCRVRYLKIQRKLFRRSDRELTKEDYTRLWSTANGQGKHRLALLMETICATGIRVSEVRYITMDAIQSGRADVSLKGKIRTILLPGKLCRKLQKYAKKQKIVSGEVFLTRNGRGLSRRQIWAEMKALCKAAGVAASKVFPHNLRHLFARTFYKVYKDVARLADVLGHSSIEHAQQMERLGLIS